MAPSSKKRSELSTSSTNNLGLTPQPKKLDFDGSSSSEEPAGHDQEPPSPSCSPSSRKRAASREAARKHLREVIRECYEPPPKRLQRIVKPPERKDNPADYPPNGAPDRFPKLNVLTRESAQFLLAQQEKKLQDKRMRQKLAKDAKLLKGKWDLKCCPKGLDKFIYSASKRTSFEKCLANRAKKLLNFLKETSYQKVNLLVEYDKLSLEMVPFTAFDGMISGGDEAAFIIRLLAKKNRKWGNLATVILGSVGLHQKESGTVLIGANLAYYPFLLSRGNGAILDQIFRFLKDHHVGEVLPEKFRTTDMWRVIGCAMFFCQKLKKKKKRENVVTLTVASEGNEDRTFTIALSKELLDQIRQIRRSWSGQESGLVMTSNQIRLIKQYVESQIDGVVWRSSEITTFSCAGISATNTGNFYFRGASEATAFLYFYSRFRTRSDMHPLFSITFDEVQAP